MIEQLVSQALKNFALQHRWNTLQSPWSSNGWPMALPEVDWTDQTRLVLHFQDRITPSANGCCELEAIEARYGSRANQVIVIYYSHGLKELYSGPVQLVEFSTHNWLTVTDLLRIQDQWAGQFDQPKTQAWQCLNGRQCSHRHRAATVLQSWPNGTLSYGNEIPLTQWSYQTYFGTENYENFVRLLPVYQRCAVNIVTETDYDARPGVICEKTLYAFVAGQIPIVIGHPGAVQDCKDLGFDMFDDLVDISYDWLPNSQRVETALESNRDVILGHIDLELYQHRIRRNQEYVMGAFLEWMQNRAQEDLSRIF